MSKIERPVKLPRYEQIPALPSFFMLDKSHQDALMQSDKLHGVVANYWEKKFEGYKRIKKTDYSQRVKFLTSAIEEIEVNFGESGLTACRRAYYQLGLNFERAANDFGEKSFLFIAADCYIHAEMLFGMWTGYAPRAINCFAQAGQVGIAQLISNQMWGDNGPIVMQDNEI